MRTTLIAAAILVVAALAPAAAASGATGSGTVFLPNPVAELQDQTLTDQKDADYPALRRAYHVVRLTNLDRSGYLVGDWANVVRETGRPAFSATNSFNYNRHDDGFEQVMA